MLSTTLLGLPILGWLLLLVAIGAVSTVVYLSLVARQRSRVLRRATGDATQELPEAERSETAASLSRVSALLERIPGASQTSEGLAQKLVQAGFESPAAGSVFGIIRVVSGLGIPAIGLLLSSTDDLKRFALTMLISVAIGVLGPTAFLDRMIQQRQDAIRKGIPDTLDLLVVCLEAGVALDAAVQRVSRELKLVHDTLSNELVGMSRRMAAGVPREQAMQSLYTRTGVDELRSLSSHMIQSEKWGTSIVTVLRVYGDQLRRKRRMEAEKRAATASTRMLFPLMVFIFPTIFVVLLGPAMMRIGTMFSAMGG